MDSDKENRILAGGPSSSELNVAADAPHSRESGETASAATVFASKVNAAETLANNLLLFGRVEQFATPFTRQLLVETRRLFPHDKATFDGTDKVAHTALSLYLFMRLCTLVTFIVALGIPLALLYRYNIIFSILSSSTIFAFMLLLVLWVVRNGIRHFFLEALIAPRIANLGHLLSGEMRQLERQMHAASGNIANPSDGDLPNLTWRQRASGFTKILLWYAKRLEAVDRYATTVFWKQDMNDRIVESCFRWVKFVIVFTLLASIYIISENTQIEIDRFYVYENFLFLALYNAVALFGWFTSKKDGKHYWSDIISKKISPSQTFLDGEGSNFDYISIVSTRVENLVDYLQLVGRSRDSTRNGGL